MPAPCAYRYAALDRTADVQAADEWLSPRERELRDTLRDEQRRTTWHAGRIAAKQLAQERFLNDVQPATLEIDSGDPRARRQRPCLRVAGRALPWSLSIAHSRRGVLVALATERAMSVGADLVEPLRFGPGFAATWFSAAERRWIERGAAHSTATAWAVKEAAYKAVNRGEPFRPRHFEVFPAADGALVCRWSAAGIPINRVCTWITPQGDIAALVITCSLSPVPCNLPRSCRR